MALNPSGPISFGGPTAGESINLELGVSATALASINSTPFRDLAGIPSGTIALSNFYGKSSNSFWALSANTNVLGLNGFAVALNGTLAISASADGTSAANAIYFFNSNGGLINAARVNSYADGVQGPTRTFMNYYVNNNTVNDPVFYPVVQNALHPPWGVGAFKANENVNYFGNNWLWNRTLANTQFNFTSQAAKNIIVHPGVNQLYIVPQSPRRTVGKAQYVQTNASAISPSGVRFWNRISFPSDANDDAFSRQYSIARTDNQLVVVGAGAANTHRMYVLETNTANVVSTFSCSLEAGNNSQNVTMLSDSSNNIYICTSTNFGFILPRIYKINSSYAPAGARVYYPSSSGSTQAGKDPSFALHAGIIYIISTTEVQNRFALGAINASTLLPMWTLNILANGAVSNSDIYSGSRSSVAVSSLGVYVLLNINNFVSFVKVPLDGNISGTENITAPSGRTGYSVTFTKVTSGPTNMESAPINLAVASVTNILLQTITPEAGAGTTPVSGATPATTLSQF
jgi:hypothetical protein